MRSIETEGYLRPHSIAPGTPPVLRFLAIADLVIDPAFKAPIVGRGRAIVAQIAESFSWRYFGTVVVATLQNGKYVIIDGHRRTTAAALVGIAEVPCQIVEADSGQQQLAAKAIDRARNVFSRMAKQARAHDASEAVALRAAEICARANVELLRYPVPADRQAAGQTMAVATIAQCLKHYGEETLITALQCVTQTTNNRPAVLSARVIKALCAILGSDQPLRDSGLVLFEIFDKIDLLKLARASEVDAAANRMKCVDVLVKLVRTEISRQVARRRDTKSPRDIIVERTRQRTASLISRGPTAPAKSVQSSSPTANKALQHLLKP